LFRWCLQQRAARGAADDADERWTVQRAGCSVLAVDPVLTSSRVRTRECACTGGGGQSRAPILSRSSKKGGSSRIGFA
jgi:hypothetical protein